MSNGSGTSPQELYFVQNLDEPLLGEPTAKILNLLNKINMIKCEDLLYKKYFSCVFRGVKKLRHVYKIPLDETAQPFSIAALKRPLLPMTKKVKQELKSLEKEKINRPVKSLTD